MIKLFITDLDGCLTKPFKTPDWDLLTQIRRLNAQSKIDDAVPPLTICSGRPLPYVEAVAQWLDIDQPMVFESAGVYRLSENKVELAEVFNDGVQNKVAELKEWLQQEIISQYSNMTIEFSKLMDAGLIHSQKEVIDEVYPMITDYVSTNYPEFEVHNTDVSVNIILANNNKRNGIQAICKSLDITVAEVAYIGDSSGDIPGLEIVGRPFAPKNAFGEVKKHAQVMSAEVTAATLMAYRQVVEENRKALSMSA